MPWPTWSVVEGNRFCQEDEAVGQCEKQPLSVITLFIPYILMLHCHLEVFGGRRGFRFNKWNTTKPLSIFTCLK